MTEWLTVEGVPWAFISLILGLGVLIMLGVKARRNRKKDDQNNRRWDGPDVLGVF